MAATPTAGRHSPLSYRAGAGVSTGSGALPEVSRRGKPQRRRALIHCRALVAGLARRQALRVWHSRPRLWPNNLVFPYSRGRLCHTGTPCTQKRRPPFRTTAAWCVSDCADYGLNCLLNVSTPSSAATFTSMPIHSSRVCQTRGTPRVARSGPRLLPSVLPVSQPPAPPFQDVSQYRPAK